MRAEQTKDRMLVLASVDFKVIQRMGSLLGPKERPSKLSGVLARLQSVISVSNSPKDQWTGRNLKDFSTLQFFFKALKCSYIGTGEVAKQLCSQRARVSFRPPRVAYSQL